jgi:uncharacterized protein
VRRLTSQDYRKMPWRNGGGVTTELLVEPPSSDRFLYRVSVADVASDGPFSRFEGYDRHIMLVDGAGMTLDCGEHGRIDLTARYEPRTFSGDWEVHGKLTAGAVRDFNLIVDRARATSSLEVRVLDAPERLTATRGTTCFLHLLEGSLDVAREGDTLVIDTPLELVPRSSARVVIGRIALRASA